MAEYIERSKVAEMLDAIYENGWTTKYSVEMYVNTAQQALMLLPGADVAPVVHGHWLTWNEKFSGNAVGKNLGVFCSVCENHSDYSSLYCAACGAKMDEGDENENLS